MEQGHYLNAMIQLRSLLDYFVSCRYLHHHPQHVIPYRKGEKCLVEGRKKWLGPTEIYGYFSEIFNRQYYGDMLSSITHGKKGPSIYRIDRSNPAEPRVILVPEFNLKHAFVFINHFVPIVYGYLSHREIFFKDRLKELPFDVNEECKATLAWLDEYHRKQAVKYPESKEWVAGINAVLGISWQSSTALCGAENSGS